MVVNSQRGCLWAIFLGALTPPHPCGCPGVCAVIYALCYSFIAVSRKLQHSLVNIWVCMVWLFFLFVTGIRQTGHTPTCRLVGLLLHFLSLASLLWILCAVHIIYNKARSFEFGALFYPLTLW